MDERRDPNDFYPKGYAPVKIKTALEFIGMDTYQVRTVYRDSYYMAMWCKEHGLCTHRFSVRDALVIASFGYVFDDVDLYDKTPQYLLNQSLFHRTADDMEDIKDFLFLVLRSLRHLRPVTGTQLYYASDERVQVDSEHYVVGDTISWPIFTSATTDMASLLPGLTAPNGTTRGTLFIIDNAVGYDIQPYLIPKKKRVSDSSDPNSDLERASKAPKIVLEPDISFVVRRAIPGELTIIALEVIEPKRKFLGKVISRYEMHKSDKRPEKSIRVVAPPPLQQQQQDESKDGEISKDGDGKPSGPKCPMSPRLIQTQLRISHRRTLSDPSSPKSKMPAPLVLFSSALSDSALSGNDSDDDSDDEDDDDDDDEDEDEDDEDEDEEDDESESYSHSSSEYSSDTSSSSSSDNVYVSVSESESESSSGSYTASSSETSSYSDSGSDSNYTNSSSSYSSSGSGTASESEEDEIGRNRSKRVNFKSKMSKNKNIKKGNPKHHDVSHKSKNKKHDSSKSVSKKKKAVKTSNRR